MNYFLRDFVNYILTNILFLSVFLFVIAFTRNLSTNKRKIVLSAAFTIFICIFIFSLFEAYFRYIYDESDGLNFLKVQQKWSQRHVVYNSDFFRDRQFKTEKDGDFIRIGVIGDSLTFGAGVKKEQDRFSNLLEKKLKEIGKKVEVYNFGIPGVDTQEEMETYQKVKKFNLDIVILQYYLNDIQTKDKSGSVKIFQQSEQKNTIIKKLSTASYFFDFLYWKLGSSHSKTYKDLNNLYLDDYSDTNIFNNHKDDLINFANTAKTDNKKFIVIIFPLIHLLKDYPVENVHKELSSVFTSQGVEVVDLLDELKGKDPDLLMASRFDSHPNEKVHAQAAEKLYNLILKDIN